jgi:hypothetical protein
VPEPDTTPTARVSARERAEAIVDAACPEEEIQARLDDYAVEVARSERVAAYRSAADELAAAANPHTERGAGVQWAADRLRARADQMGQP